MPSLGIRPYHKGLVHLGRSGYTWLQPDGVWGWSNAGLITNGDRAHESTRMMAAPIKRAFEGTLDSSIDARRVHPKQAGPAHKHGDTTMLFGLAAKLNRSRR